MARKKTKKAKRRLFFFGTLSIFVIFYFIFNLCFFSYRIVVLEKSKKDLENQLHILQNSEEDLKNDIVKLKDPNYIADYARENYMYSKDGEIVIKINEAENEVVVDDNSFDYKYLIFVCCSCLVIVVLYVIRKFRK